VQLVLLEHQVSKVHPALLEVPVLSVPQASQARPVFKELLVLLGLSVRLELREVPVLLVLPALLVFKGLQVQQEARDLLVQLE